MRLTVNGVVVRVVDRIEIEFDVHREGEELPGGIRVRCRGGELTIRPGQGLRGAFDFETEKTMYFYGAADPGAYFVATVAAPPIAGDYQAAHFSRPDDGPAISITKDV